MGEVCVFMGELCVLPVYVRKVCACMREEDVGICLPYHRDFILGRKGPGKGESGEERGHLAWDLPVLTRCILGSVALCLV